MWRAIIVVLVVLGLVPVCVEPEVGDSLRDFIEEKYSLEELIEKNNLTEQKQLWSFCFDSNEEIKAIAQNLSVYEIQEWILEFPYDYEQLSNLSTQCQRATETLKNGKGICIDKAILVCSVCYEKSIPCYVLSSFKFKHSIALIYYNGWKPVLTTGFIENNISEFMSSLNLIESKNKRYFKI